MNCNAIAAISQVVGSIAVVFSVLYLAIQVHRSTRVAKVSRPRTSSHDRAPRCDETVRGEPGGGPGSGVVGWKTSTRFHRTRRLVSFMLRFNSSRLSKAFTSIMWMA